MTHSMKDLRQRLRRASGESIRAWQRSVSHIVRDHFDDIEKHVRMGFRYADVMGVIEAVRLEQFLNELDRWEEAAKKRLLVDSSDQKALAQLEAIPRYRIDPPFRLINERTFGQAMFDERNKRKKAGTYYFSGPRIVLPGVRAPQLFIEFDDDPGVQDDISDGDSGPATTSDIASDLLSGGHDPASPSARGELPAPSDETTPTKPPARNKRTPAIADSGSRDEPTQQVVVPQPGQSQATRTGNPTAPFSDSTSLPPVPDPARDPALPATEAPGSTARISSLSRRHSGPAVLDFD